jgi:hypothetical protein
LAIDKQDRGVLPDVEQGRGSSRADPYEAEHSVYGWSTYERDDDLDDDVYTQSDVDTVEALSLYALHHPVRVPGHEDWIVLATFQDVPQAPRLHEIRVRPLRNWAPAPGLATEVLRSIRVGDLYRAVLTELRDRRFDLHWDTSVDAEFDRNPRPGRRGRDDAFYAEWAARYVSMLNHPSPVAELARQHNYSESQIRNFLHEARKRELLTAAPRGRADGQLTDKATAILDGRST